MEPASDYRTRLYRDYAANLQEGGDHPSRADYYDRRVIPLLERGNHPVLELGCGAGQLLLHLVSRGFASVQGVDASLDQVQRARAAGAQAHHGDALAWLRSQPACSAGAVIAMDVFEHLKKDEALPLLDEIHRTLRPGGRCIVHTVNAASPFFGTVRYGDFTHETAFTPGSLAQVLRSVGFCKIESLEDSPVIHGPVSLGRAIIWQAFRHMAVLALAAETGAFDTKRVLSQNFLTVAHRSRP